VTLAATCVGVSKIGTLKFLASSATLVWIVSTIRLPNSDTPATSCMLCSTLSGSFPAEFDSPPHCREAAERGTGLVFVRPRWNSKDGYSLNHYPVSNWHVAPDMGELIRSDIAVIKTATTDRKIFLANFCQTCRENGPNRGQTRGIENQKILVDQGFSSSSFPGASASTPFPRWTSPVRPRSPAP
jgi:hypothetical protein